MIVIHCVLKDENFLSMLGCYPDTPQCRGRLASFLLILYSIEAGLLRLVVCLRLTYVILLSFTEVFVVAWSGPQIDVGHRQQIRRSLQTGRFGGTPLEHPHRHASPLRRRRHPRYRKPWCCSYFALLVSSRATEALPAAPAYIPCTTDTSSNLWATTPKVSRLKPPDRAPSG